jgi:hypothetical protein
VPQYSLLDCLARWILDFFMEIFVVRYWLNNLINQIALATSLLFGNIAVTVSCYLLISRESETAALLRKYGGPPIHRAIPENNWRKGSGETTSFPVDWDLRNDRKLYHCKCSV